MSSAFQKFMIHVDIGTDEKLASLNDSERLCHIVGILAIAAKSPVRGCLIVGDLEATPEHIAARAGVTARVAVSATRKLVDVGVLIHDEDLGCLRVHNWTKFNPPPKHDKTAAERAQRYRDRKASRLASRRDATAVTPPVTAASRLRHGGEVEEQKNSLKTTGLAPKVFGADRPNAVGVPDGETRGTGRAA